MSTWISVGATLECTYYAKGDPEPPGAIKARADENGEPTQCLPEDKLAPNVVFVSYGTAVNADSNVNDDLSDDEEELIGRPADLFYARTTDYGTTYEYAEYETYASEDTEDLDPEIVWDWTALAKDSGGGFFQQGEAQLRSTPAGNHSYASWLEEEEEAQE